jgi:23S rRNA (uracil1939-C5)-methyltransferase
LDENDLSEDPDIEIEKLVYGGDGLAHLGGRVVMLPFVLPGERVRARVTRARGSYLRAEPAAVTQASPHRETPLCRYFGRCGGCHYQHMSYGEELEQKRLVLREVLRRIGKINYEGDIPIVSGEPWGYRNRIQLHIADRRAGYFQAESRKLCAIESCPVASPALHDAIGKLNSLLPGLPRRELDLELFTSEAEVQVNGPRRLFESLGTPEPIDYDGLRVSRHSFFQVNRFLIPRLVECVLDDAGGAEALDLYAGVGLFARALAARFSTVTAVESGGSSHHDSAANAARSNRPWNPVQSNTEDFLSGWSGAAGFIVADPPRAGLGPAVVRDLLRLRAPRVAIVSCDPSTLARDLAGLSTAYAIRKITLVDLFPRTAHLETVVQLQAL